MARKRRDYKGELEYDLALLPMAFGLDWVLAPEYIFHPTRKWRLDWAYLTRAGHPVGIAVEYDGIMLRTVGHNSLAGILRDSEKSNEAQALGWQVFRANAKNCGDGSFLDLMHRVLEGASR